MLSRDSLKLCEEVGIEGWTDRGLETLPEVRTDCGSCAEHDETIGWCEWRHTGSFAGALTNVTLAEGRRELGVLYQADSGAAAVSKSRLDLC
jgi:hypothetical protein